MFRKILVPLDGSRFALRALKYAIEIAQRFEAEIVFIQVIKPATPPVFTGYPGDATAATMEAALDVTNKLDKKNLARSKRYLDGKVQTIKCQGLTGAYNVAIGDPAHSIIDYANKENVDLIVMTTHSKSGLKRAILGSVADTVIRDSGKPVMVMHPKPHASKHSK